MSTYCLHLTVHAYFGPMTRSFALLFAGSVSAMTTDDMYANQGEAVRSLIDRQGMLGCRMSCTAMQSLKRYNQAFWLTGWPHLFGG